MSLQHGNTAVSQRSILLIPWDPDSTAHVERMRQQRIACGWKVEKIADWQKFQRAGKLIFYWIVLAASYPNRDALIGGHLERYPDEVEQLQDTCRSVLGNERTPDSSKFHPVGHICLDGCVENHENNRLMISPANGIYTIAAFYVSTALQGTGIGGLTVSTLERIAAEQYGAKVFTLDTLSNEDTDPNSPRMIALGRERPKVPVLDWYARRGYVIYETVKDGVENTDSTGKKWYSTLLYMKKDISK